MDPSSYKPLDVPSELFSDIDKLVDQLLAENNVSEVSQLPLSCFSNYTAKKENLNLYNQLRAVETFIGNDMMYISAGSTSSQYITGVAVDKQNNQQNLLNINNPTCNFIPERQRVTYDQIGGFFLPQFISPLTYASFSPSPVILHDKIEPNEQYILPDTTIYGAVFGNTSHGVDLPIDHIENNSLFKPPVVDIGMNGRVYNAEKIPTFHNYTSTEITLGAPKFGVSKFTDNYDFWANSSQGDVWANQDVYELTEANKFYITERSYELLTDLCESPYRWRTDIYGNEYLLYKPATFLNSKIHGGSDTNHDGIDDKIGSNDPDSKPKYDPDDGSPDGVDPGKVGEGGSDPSDPGGSDIGDTGGGGSKIDEDTGEEIVDDDVPQQKEAASQPTQFSVRECNFWLYGGDSFSPTDETAILDWRTFDVEDPESGGTVTVTGTVSSIIDGGWRPQRTGTQATYTPGTTQIDSTTIVHWPINGSAAEDQTENEAQVMATGTYGADYVNGFFDIGMYEHQTTDALGATEEVEWIPDYTIGPTETSKMTVLTDTNADVEAKWTTVFNSVYSSPPKWRPTGDPAYNAADRSEADPNFRYKLADGGWQDPLNTDINYLTFTRVNCDRASYIVGTFGASGRPDFGSHVFACRLWDLTDSPATYLDTVKMREYVKKFMVTSTLPEEQKDQEAQEIIDQQIANARERGPMHAQFLRSPINFVVETSVGKPPIQFFGPRNALVDWLANATPPVYTPAEAEEEKTKVNRLWRYNYLEELEYLYMRVSPIDGTGVGTIDFETASLYKVEEDGTRVDTAQFFNLTGRDTGTLSSKDHYSRGDADMFYYHGHPNDNPSPVPGQYTQLDGTGKVFYSSVSADCTYINNVTEQDEDGYKVKLRDLDGRGTQFPQVYHNNGVRRATLTLQEYQDNIGCNTVAEFRYAPQSYVDNKFYEPLVQNPEINISVPVSHPFEQTRGQKFELKRGYWPPPVAQLRRTNGYSEPTVTGTGANRVVTFNDEPIKNNLMPEEISPGTFDDFYLHDIWDGSGFGGYFENQVNNKYKEDDDETEGENDLDDGSGTVGDGCADGRSPTELAAQGIIGFVKVPDGDSHRCIVQCNWREGGDWVPNEDFTACIEDAEAAEQKRQENGIGDGGGGGDDDIGSCATCITLGGTFIRNSCGGYDGFNSTVEVTAENESPCYPGKYVPMKAISNLRKFASDLGDWCLPADGTLPTIWEQQNLPLLDVYGSGDKPSTAFFRNTNNRVIDLHVALDSLVSKYEGINQLNNNVLTTDCKLIDFDIVYDTIVLRYNTNDSRATDHDPQSYIFDTILYDESIGRIDFTGTDTKFIKTQLSQTSQLLQHFFNEDENIIIVGRTFTPDYHSHEPIVPEIHRLDLSTGVMSQIYPTPAGPGPLYSLQVNNHILPFTISSDYKIQSIDPGHISYNADTNNYIVTYIAYLASKTDSEFVPTPVIITTLFTFHNGEFEYIDSCLHHNTITSNTTTEIEDTESQTIQLYQNDQATIDIYTNAFESKVELNLAGLDVNISDLHIDWGDGETVNIYTDFHSTLPRYTGSTSYINRYTYVIPDKSGAQAKTRQSGTSLVRHNVVHTYQPTGGQTYVMQISGVYTNTQTTFNKTINVVANDYSVNQISNNKGVKILNTKLFTNHGEEKLLITLEMQGNKRYIGNNVLTVSN